MKVLVVTAKVPFVRGGAEVLADDLVAALRACGCVADLVAIPFKHYPPERILDQILACRLLDVTETFGEPVDRVIALKFPAYLIPHDNKVLWILHQHRQAYDLWDDCQAGGLSYYPNGLEVRDAILAADRNFIPQARSVFALSNRVSSRLKEHCDLRSIPLYAPPPGADGFYCSASDDYLFLPSRIGPLKRQDLILEALRSTREPVRVRFAGRADNSDWLGHCHNLVKRWRLENRVEWLGEISDDQKRQLYANCRGVVFPPRDEDYGYVTLEAMLSSKPVITCSDSGGPLEFIVNRQHGIIAEPSPEAMAQAMDEVWSSPQAFEWGRAARQRYDDIQISWEKVVERLLA